MRLGRRVVGRVDVGGEAGVAARAVLLAVAARKQLRPLFVERHAREPPARPHRRGDAARGVPDGGGGAALQHRVALVARVAEHQRD